MLHIIVSERLKNRFFSTLLVFLLVLFLLPSLCPATAPETYPTKTDLQSHYQQAKFYYNQLKNTTSLGASRSNWLKGAGNFRRIYLAEPKSELAPSCLFMLGRLYHEAFKKFGQGIDLGEAISYYRDVNTLFPGNRLADDALFAVGTILLEDVSDPTRAAEAFGKIVSDYPEGDMRTEAENSLKVLSKEHEIPLPQEMLGTTRMEKLTNVMPVKYWSSADYTRVVVQTSGPTTYREKLLEQIGDQPRRLYIDFQNSYIEPRFRAPVPIQDGLLKRVRTGQFSPETVRVVLDIESISDYKIFSLPDPFRVVIDVRGKPKQAPPALSLNPLSPPPAPPAPPSRPSAPGRPAGEKQGNEAGTGSSAVAAQGEPAETPQPTGPPPPPEPEVAREDGLQNTQREDDIDEAQGPIVVLHESKKRATDSKTVAAAPGAPSQKLSLAQQLGLGIGTIVIDPGHGGKDPGAIAFGMKEKDIVLSMAKNLAKHLREDLSATVILTRDNDQFLPLEERTAIANTSDADLFISLHINAHPSPQVKGFETYFLNLSTNEEAMRVAARENATTTHQMSDLQDILSDIMQNSKINESSRLARLVHDSMVSGLSEPPFALKNMGVKQAPFYVLIGAEMPAILIELAFISNPEDARLLADDTFIDAMAKRISGGISGYASTNTASL